MTPPDRSLAEYWPIFGLRLATPRLTLTPLQDEDLVEVLDVVLAGIHDPAQMPFALAWTDAPREELVPSSLRFYWNTRASSTPQAWTVPFVVRAGAQVVGVQDLSGRAFAVTRTVSTGSWLGAAFHRRGWGTEMRSAVVQFAFDHLKAQRAESGAFVDNAASLRVSEKLGYSDNGTRVAERRPGERAVEQRLVLEPGAMVRQGWAVQVRGLPACQSFFGI